MNTVERLDLRNLLIGYFGDNTTEDGVREMLGVTRAHTEYHQRYRRLLENGLQAARAGDEEVFSVIRELAPFLPDIAAGVSLLEEILVEYDRQYAVGASGR
jgi:hypothetical protein